MSAIKKILEKLFLGEKEIITDPITLKTKILYKSSLNKFLGWLVLFSVFIILLTLKFTNNLKFNSKNTNISKDVSLRLLERTDSLSKELGKYQLYVNSLKDVIDGNVTSNYDSLVNDDYLIPIVEHKLNKDSISPSEEDIEFREEIIEDDFSTIAVNTYELEDIKGDKLIFFSPVKGIVTSKYDITEEHLAVDIACDEGRAIKATMKGVVVFSDWTSDSGYVLVLQHRNNIISVYKHNSQLYKREGDVIRQGDVIAAAGSSGELSTGSHLHFELWIEGYAVDPETYMDF